MIVKVHKNHFAINNFQQGSSPIKLPSNDSLLVIIRLKILTN